MATAKARRKAKPAAKGKGRRFRRGSKGRRRKVPGTTVVHVDPEVYGLLKQERKPEDRGYNAPLRRLLGLAPLEAAS